MNTETRAHYLLLARTAHNEKAAHHPNSKEYAALQQQCSEYTKLAYASADIDNATPKCIAKNLGFLR